MTRRAGAFALSLLLVALPTLNDKCDLGCDGNRSASHAASAAAGSCPLHHGMPAASSHSDPRPVNPRDTCGHDHSTIRAAEVGAPNVLSPDAGYFYAAFAHSDRLDLSGGSRLSATPMRSRPSAPTPKLVALRI